VTPVPDRWTFSRDGRSFVVPVSPRLVVNAAEAAVDAALAGLGPTCLLSYQVDAHVRAGTLARILGPFEPPAIPVQVVTPAGRFVTPIVRAFVDASAEALRRALGSSNG
jgi:DNA-binding transcriptional LysR family regulator